MNCKEIRFTRRKDGSDRGVAKNLEISFLLDFYGDMLTDKQRDVVELYYNEDLSLAEIAAHSGITRQGVRDSIKRGEAILLDLEEKVGFARRHREMQSGLEQLGEALREMQAGNKSGRCTQEEMAESIAKMQAVVDRLAQ